MIVTVVPVAPAATAKTRLAGVLDDTSRRDLARRLLVRTVAAARPLGPVLIVSRSARMRSLAKRSGAEAAIEDRPDLNAAVAQGLAVAGQRTDTALVLPSDLPRVTTEHLRDFVSSAAGPSDTPVVVVAPCQRSEGTNALLLRPPSIVVPRFGANSLRAHVAGAEAAGVRVVVHCSPGLVDLDTPADLLSFGPWTPPGERCRRPQPGVLRSRG